MHALGISGKSDEVASPNKFMLVYDILWCETRPMCYTHMNIELCDMAHTVHPVSTSLNINQMGTFIGSGPLKKLVSVLSL